MYLSLFGGRGAELNFLKKTSFFLQEFFGDSVELIMSGSTCIENSRGLLAETTFKDV